MIDWGGVRIGVLICADVGQLGWWREHAAQGAQLMCNLNCNSGRANPDCPTNPDMARELGVPVLESNHIPSGAFFIGNSMIVDRDGTTVAAAPAQPDIFVIGDLTLAPRR